MMRKTGRTHFCVETAVLELRPSPAGLSQQEALRPGKVASCPTIKSNHGAAEAELCEKDSLV